MATPIVIQVSEQPYGLLFTLEWNNRLELQVFHRPEIPDRILVGTSEPFPRINAWVVQHPENSKHLLSLAKELTGQQEPTMALRGVFLTTVMGPMSETEKRAAPKLWVWPYPSELWGPDFPWGAAR